MEDLDSRPKAETKTKPRRKGHVFLGVPRDLAAAALADGVPVGTVAMVEERDDALAATAKFAAMGLHCGNFERDDSSGYWYSGIVYIPAERYEGFIEAECEHVEIGMLGDVAVDRYRLVNF